MFSRDISQAVLRDSAFIYLFSKKDKAGKEVDFYLYPMENDSRIFCKVTMDNSSFHFAATMKKEGLYTGINLVTDEYSFLDRGIDFKLAFEERFALFKKLYLRMANEL